MESFKVRVFVVFSIIVLFFFILVGRLFFIQVVKGKEYAAKSVRQSKRRVIIPATRGTIRDRTGMILAESIAKKVEYSDTLWGDSGAIESKKVAIKRIYPNAKLLASVIGYVGRDGRGLSGVEYGYNKELRGENGWDIVQKDGRNRRYSRIGMPGKMPKDGADVYLTINSDVQRIAEHEVEKMVKKIGAKSGECVIMDPYTGDVLAMVSYPGFNPNSWSIYSPFERQNRCIGYNYEPGSTFKVFTSSIAIEENVISETDSINGNNGRFEIYDQIIRDHKAYGMITFADALSYSSNVCFAQVANRIGDKKLYSYAINFGIGSRTGIELPGEEKGLVRPIEEWSGRTRVTMAIGQEISSTVIQMATAFSAVANGGVLLEPHIVKKIIDSDGSIILEHKATPKRRVISDSTALRVRRMMSGVVRYGTAKRIYDEDIPIAGKTGTSQKFDKETDSYSDEKVWASFIGMTPVEKPALVCAVVIDEPANGEAGGVVAAPVFYHIVKRMISDPSLNFADFFVSNNLSRVVSSGRQFIITPNFINMDLSDALQIIKKSGLKATVVGDGKCVVRQLPQPEVKLVKDSKIILYTGIGSLFGEVVTVPNCLGKDVRDAVNILSSRKIKSVVKGYGIVKRQFPKVGSMVKIASVCTLSCYSN